MNFLGSKYSERDIDLLIKEVDQTENGDISFEEFLVAFQQENLNHAHNIRSCGNECSDDKNDIRKRPIESIVF